ncbi:Mor transcription activator family protein [Brevibacillus centrosporus]|uniref:Mor transcription activator family protein n=1 Tax=Brevibacillus centrosporus TaxID=54910 RepID=A0A1I3M1R9_9BACL|nr:Mor transcription activator family protein [Brevibacillus centrosporus]SFI90646.1 Mor transcription activator family protein [Brevibacillus centrosporus]
MSNQANIENELMIDGWMKEVAVEDLPPSIQQIADVIGFRPALLLIKHYGGEMLYLPKPDSIYRSFRDKRIKQEFNGYNYKELAQKYGITVSWVREILADTPHPDQMNIFEIEA